MSALTDWWQARAVREQLALGLGAAGLALVLAWLFGVEPLARRAEAAGRQLAVERATGTWLAGVAPAAGSAPAAAGLAEGETALGVLNESLRSAGLDTTLKRMTPTGEAAFELGFEGAGWQPLAAWLQTLAATRGARVTAAHVEKTATPGLVNASLSLALVPGAASKP